jgi:hypothetical protein
MKKILSIILLSFFLISCSLNQTVEAQFEFDGAIQRIGYYNKGTSKEELMNFVKNSSNAEKTTFFYFYPKNEIDISMFSKETFSSSSLNSTILNNKPDYSFYKMPNDEKVYDDAIYLLEQSQK